MRREHATRHVVGAGLAALLVAGGPYASAARAAAPVDTVPPTITGIGLAGGTTVNGTVTLRPAVSDDTAVTRVELRHYHLLAATSTTAPFELRWDTRKYSDNRVQLTITAYDAAGNSATSEIVTVLVDNDAPFITFPWYFTDSLNQMASMSFTGIVPIDFTKWGLDADTAGIELSVGSTIIGTATAAPWIINWDTSAYTGRTTLTARGRDTFGNTHTARSTVWADHTGPAISAPRFDWTPGLIGAGGQIHSYVTDGADVRKAELLVDGTVRATAMTNDRLVTFSWPVGIPNGPASMTIRAKDTLGNISEHTQTVTVDNDKPVVVLTPAAGALVRGTASPAAITSYRDASGIAYFHAGLGEHSTAVRQAPWRVGFDTLWFRDGRRTLNFQIFDKAGNPTLVTRVVTVDNTVPTVSIVNAPRNNTVLRKSIKLKATARDAYGINRVQLLINGKVVATDARAAYSFTVNPKKYGKKFTVLVRAYDRAGNVKYTAKRTYRR